jgi:single-stranded-DNA-specific exonuclease
VVYDLPHRLRDGYGFSPDSARRLARAGAQVIVTVDCGISDHEGIKTAQSLGLGVVVTDHHQLPPGEMIPAEAVINPHQPGCALANELAGVGVAFYLAAGLRASLKKEGYFSTHPEPNLLDSLDFVAVGTLADVVPVMQCNRILVKEGLKVLNRFKRPGFRALALVGGQRGQLDPRDIGFTLAPRINAAGRLDHPAKALELLLTKDYNQALFLAGELDRLNTRRKEVEYKVFEEAKAEYESRTDYQDAKCLVLAKEGWHKGVLGIVASRMVTFTGKPIMLMTKENGKAVGSARSLPGFHMQKALAGLEHLLTSYGGHALAAAASLPTEKLPEFARSLDNTAQEQIPPQGLERPLEPEALVTLSDMTPQAMKILENLAPFGPGHPEPLLYMENARVISSQSVGKDSLHLKMEISQQGRTIRCFGFNLAERRPPDNTNLDVVFSPRISNYGQRHLELMLEDFRTVG